MGFLRPILTFVVILLLIAAVLAMGAGVIGFAMEVASLYDPLG